ncbi:type II secretion system F family protein [Fimbriiglobus ruber]|uniref:Flp pilus assembly protein TadB n=1 Tax=Fimbriiglobus ruber TaxID=1908690 RepID=A0A225DU13_9BACT|nr:type II secretion system F family protein [Fimbriiglobus ruber]OWK44533.1 Flp pilus assembly protein TadB [Fimbriiglobus ruber]
MLQIGIFVAVTGGALALLLASIGGGRAGQERIRRRLAGKYGVVPVEVATPLYKDVDALDANFGSDGRDTPIAVAAPGRTVGRRQRAEEFLRQADVELSVRQILWFVAGVALLLGGIGVGVAGWLGGIGGVAAGLVVPVVVLNAKRRARRERYVRQLAGAFELMARVLRAGQSIPEAFRAAVEAFEDPLSGEFGRCLHQIEHGLRPDAAFRELSQRSGVVEMRIFVVAMVIQRQTGGNLGEVLDRLAAVVQARFKMRQKLRALTAEGRLQSLTLTVLPVITFVVMYFLNRQYAEALLDHWKLLAGTGACMGVGVLWIRNIMNFEG